MSESPPAPVAADMADDILAGLSGAEGLPRDALRAAAENWDAVLPVFLDMLEDCIQERETDEENEGALFFILHLFGQMRETRAYRPLMLFLSTGDDRVHGVLGNGVTETLSRIAVSVFDGDPQPLQSVIKSENADEYVRGSMLETLAFLTKEGRVDLKDTESFLLQCYGELRPQRGSYVWIGWQGAISYLGLTEFKSLVRKAFATGRIGSWFMEFRHFEQDLRQTHEAGVGQRTGDERHYGYFDDVIEELSSWYGFSEDYRREADRLAKQSEGLGDSWPEESDAPWTLEPRVNPLRHVGRNDPCPCGSGKKFKKCCLG